jgi:FkbM family methyltransferase
VSWLRRHGDKWNEQRGIRRLLAVASWAAWRILALVRNPMARDRRLRVLASAVLFEIRRHGAPRETLVTLPGGGMLLCPSWSGSSRGPVCVGLEDVEEQTFLLDTVAAGDVAIDVGAHLGTYTILMAARGAAVHAFEPSTRIRDVLARSIAENNFSQPVTVRASALSNYVGVGSLTSGYDSGNRLADRDAPRTNGGDSVAVDTLDHWAESHDLSGLFVVKVDAEGEDEHVLAGATKTLATHAPVLIVEYWKDNRSMRTFLDAHGYDVYRYLPHERRLVARPPDHDDGDGNLIACTPPRRADIERRLARPPRERAYG